jgi:hypothetical protein
MIIDYPNHESPPDGAMRYDTAQSLTDAEKLQVLENLGITRNAAGEWEVPTDDGTKRVILLDPA